MTMPKNALLTLISSCVLLAGQQALSQPKQAELAVLDPEAHFRQAARHLKLNDLDKSRLELEKTIELDANHHRALYYLAVVDQLQGKDDHAQQLLIKLLAIKPDFTQAHVSLGSLWRKQGKNDLAERAYQKAIALNFYSLEAHYNLANLWVDSNKLEDALKEYKICLKLAPNNAQVHNNLGVIYQRRNYLEEAADEFNQACNLEPTNKTFQANLELLNHPM